MNAQYNARTGRDYCCVGPKGTEKEGEMWMHSVICDRGDSGVFGTIFGDLRRDEAEFLKYFRMPVDS
jgi:hypothetical protein